MQDVSRDLPEIVGISPSLYLELPAIFAGSLSGAAHGARKGFDAVGMVVLAIASGLGGGLLRDIAIGHTPPLVLARPIYLLAALVSVLVAFLFARWLSHADPVLEVIDSLALGFFGTAGAQQALAAGIPLPGIICLGTLTAVGGSVIRDVLSNDIPVLLLPGPLYAIVAALGVCVYLVGSLALKMRPVSAELCAIGFTLVLRRLVLWRGWHSPKPLGHVAITHKDAPALGRASKQDAH